MTRSSPKEKRDLPRNTARPTGNFGPRRENLQNFSILALGLSVAALYSVAIATVDREALMDGSLRVAGVSFDPDHLSVKPHEVLSVADTRKLFATFSDMGYSLDLVRAGSAPVPRVFLPALPGDMRAIPSPEERKRIFIKTMLPLIVQANEEVRRDRMRLEALLPDLRQGKVLSGADRAWLEALAERYGTSPRDINTLTRRVDVVPTSLALAQAAEESGWGTSRFAQEGNALFGQYTTKGKGLVPLDRHPERSHKVRAFDALQDAVRAYVHNLNTHRAYGDFRRARAGMHDDPAGLDSIALAETLIRYSERGPDYIRTIQRIISANDLAALDGVTFRRPAA